MRPSFVVVEVGYGKNTGSGLYDPGANASTISLSALKKFEKYKFVPLASSYNTTSGKGSIIGITILNISIKNITERVLLYVIDTPDFPYDFIIGLDLIPVFRLSLDHKLNLSQHVSRDEPIAINNNVIWHEFMPLELFETKTPHLNIEERNSIRKIIEENRHAFAKNAFDVGNVTKYECTINLEKDVFVAKKPYRCSFEDQEEIERQCRALLENGMITESSSPFASPVTMQFKKDGLSAVKVKNRMCVDYRELNKLIIPESQPFPLIEDIIVKTRGCSWFSALDINAAFWSIPIRKSDRYKSAFVTQHGHYEWRSMPFGLKIAPAVFQRILSGIIKRYGLSDFVVNYLDDILIYSRSFEEHLVHLRKLISAIYAEGFRFNFKKCNFASSSIQYLGHILGPDTVKPMQDNLVAINQFPVPSSRKNIRQFLGKINFYRKFIPHSVSILEPFHKLLRKNVPFSWSPECQASFEKVKKLLTSEPILAIFDRTKPIFIYTDASGIGIGAVLKQTQTDGTQKPVAYFSRRLSDAQKLKKAIYIESLAIREAIRYWRFWLIGRHFTVITDHKPLQYLNLKARPDQELGDLANELLQFDFDILYRPGSDNYEADCLSRNPVLDPISDSPTNERIIPSLNFFSIDELKRLQRDVSTLDSDVSKHGIIFRKIRDKLCIVLNTEAGKQLTHTVHSKYGHIGSKHVLAIIARNFTFPNMYKYVTSYCNSCDICIRNKTRRSRRSGELGILGPATYPHEIMSLDTIGGFEGNHSSYKFLHLLVDHFSRYAYILCSKSQSAKDMIRLIDSVHKDRPIGTLLTDQYGGLTSKEFRSYCSSSNIKHVLTAVDNPSSNGLNERLNQTLVNRIRCLKNDPSTPSSSSWHSLAKKCVSQYNDTPHSVTRFAPSYLLTGSSKLIIPSSLLPPPNFIADCDTAIQNSSRYHDYNKRKYDKCKRPLDFSVGDLVYVDNGNKLNRDKLDQLRIGPFPITRKLSNNVFEICTGTGPFDKRLYHANKFLHKPCTT